MEGGPSRPWSAWPKKTRPDRTRPEQARQPGDDRGTAGENPGPGRPDAGQRRPVTVSAAVAKTGSPLAASPRRQEPLVPTGARNPFEFFRIRSSS